jgi:hypothetical protein
MIEHTKIRPFSVSNDLMDDPEALRERMRQDGYLFFCNALDRDYVLGLRNEILQVLDRHGWLQPGTVLEDGIADLSKACMANDPAYAVVYRDIVKLEPFNRHPHTPAIMRIMQLLVDEPVLPHPLTICRIMFPQNGIYTTPAHQDHAHVQGTPETYTCWMPLGDCPFELGPLAVYRGSHQAGLRDHGFSVGAGGLAVDTEPLQASLVSNGFHAGDIVIFHSLVVHEALPNRSSDRFRLSIDCRFQGVSQPISERSFLPSGGRLTWDEIYDGWQSRDLQYYWQRHQLNVVGFDGSVYDKRDVQVIAEARRGNPLTRPHLIRIIERSPDVETASAAREALQILDEQLNQTAS